MIIYKDENSKVLETQLNGFFVGWKQPLTPEQHLNLLYGSTHFIVAIDDKTNQVIGFITALSDGVNSSFIPLLEVLTDYQGQGIGKTLVEKMLLKLKDIPNVDLTCDIELQPFYEQFKMHKSHGMILRKYKNKEWKLLI